VMQTTPAAVAVADAAPKPGLWRRFMSLIGAAPETVPAAAAPQRATQERGSRNVTQGRRNERGERGGRSDRGERGGDGRRRDTRDKGEGRPEKVQPQQPAPQGPQPTAKTKQQQPAKPALEAKLPETSQEREGEGRGRRRRGRGGRDRAERGERTERPAGHGAPSSPASPESAVPEKNAAMLASVSEVDGEIASSTAVFASYDTEGVASSDAHEAQTHTGPAAPLPAPVFAAEPAAAPDAVQHARHAVEAVVQQHTSLAVPEPVQPIIEPVQTRPATAPVVTFASIDQVPEVQPLRASPRARRKYSEIQVVSEPLVVVETAPSKMPLPPVAVIEEEDAPRRGTPRPRKQRMVENESLIFVETKGSQAPVAPENPHT
jgi:ribonuclease E